MAHTHQRLAIEVRGASERLALAQKRALESRRATMSAQINPHFLLHTRNTLAGVVHEDEDQAEDLVTDLASMMRYVLDHSARRVPLRDEFDVVRLLRIEHARLGERLAFELHLDPAAADLPVPGLLAQPLVENVVQHGVAGRVDGGTVRVSADRRGDAVEIVVEDDGPGVPEAGRRHVHDPVDDDAHPGGLRNVAERARLGWPEGAAQLRIETEPRPVVRTLPVEEP